MAHVWRIRLDVMDAGSLYPILSIDEQQRAGRLVRPMHRQHFIVAHGMLRRILGTYAGVAPSGIAFRDGPHGKPAIVAPGKGHLEFNLSHSGDIALVAVTRERPVGVDVERFQEGIEHIALANRVFSPGEQRALQALTGAPARVVAAFTAAWSRKEAYLKATGHGLSRGLQHFEVSLHPDEPARLLFDSLDAGAQEHWTMTSFDAAEGYAAALVVAAPLSEVLYFDASW